MIRQSAFEPGKPILKGGLHCHTTRSDGEGAPEDVIKMHEQHGYHFLAITDHRLYNHRNFLPGSKLTIIPGMEIDRSLTDALGHCLHAVALGPEPQDGNLLKQDQAFPGGAVKDQDGFQPVLDELHRAGNITFYCHPGWSCTPTRSFDRLTGNFAMELWNTGCAVGCGMDYNNERDWDELLMMGQKVWGVAVDDGHRMTQHCRGWVQVRADNAVKDILDALVQGAFYASCGPEIQDFYIEDGMAHVRCSPVKAISFNWGGLPYRLQSYDQPVTEASFQVPQQYTYLRVTLEDAQGHMAWSNPIFLHD